MTDRQHSVLIGDDNTDRAAWISQFLGDYYNVTSLSADTFDKIRKLTRDSKRLVIILTDTLPFSYDNELRTPQSNFDQLRGVDPTVNLVYFATKKDSPAVSGQICYVRFVSTSLPTPTEREQIINSLKPLESVLPLANTTIADAAGLVRWPKLDRTLRDQIRSLSLKQDLEDGERHLLHLIRNCIDCRSVKEIHVKSLTQGKSGARVFHLNVRSRGAKSDKDKKMKEYVLKLSEAKDVWKLQSEVRGYLLAKKSELYSDYQAHIPALQIPQISKSSTEPEEVGDEFKYIASNLSWDAIYYDFLGGSLGECMPLETALISSPEKLRERIEGKVNAKFSLTSTAPAAVTAFRLNFLDTLLTALCNIWYLNQKCTKREIRLLWKGGSAPDRKYLSFPPYQLTARSRHWIQEFFDSEESKIGARLFTDWETCRDRVLALVHASNRKDLGPLSQRIPVILSPVHGDLNSNNAFLWLKHVSFPFLIDLPFYQDAGHVLQDFARLEFEMKFALMDRQEESPPDKLAAFDFTSKQVPIWQELEDSLLTVGAKKPTEPDWHSTGFRNNVRLTYRLVNLVRDKAEQTQQQICPRNKFTPDSFMSEYLPALLYHTVRAIGFPSLSIFKRLFAVYSAGSILGKLKF